MGTLGESVRLGGPRRSRAWAARARAKTRAFWRGVRCAAGPPGLELQGDHATPDVCGTAGNDAPNLGTEMTVTEFVSIAGAIKQRAPHLRAEWSSSQRIHCTAIRDVRAGGCVAQHQNSQLLAIADKARAGSDDNITKDSVLLRDDDSNENIAKEIVKLLRDGALPREHVLHRVVGVREQACKSDDDVLRLCDCAVSVADKLEQWDVIRLEVESERISMSPWCEELAAFDAASLDELLRCACQPGPRDVLGWEGEEGAAASDSALGIETETRSGAERWLAKQEGSSCLGSVRRMLAKIGIRLGVTGGHQSSGDLRTPATRLR